MWLYRRYIVKNGIRIYPKDASCFRFWIDDEIVHKEPAVLNSADHENHQNSNLNQED